MEIKKRRIFFKVNTDSVYKLLFLIQQNHMQQEERLLYEIFRYELKEESLLSKDFEINLICRVLKNENKKLNLHFSCKSLRD